MIPKDLLGRRKNALELQMAGLASRVLAAVVRPSMVVKMVLLT